MKRRIFTIVLLTTLSYAYAQNGFREIIRGERGLSKHFIALTSDQERTFNLQQIKRVLDLDEQSDLILIDQETDKLGLIHYRFYQTYKRVPIENSMLIVHTKNGRITGLSGEVIVDFDPYNQYNLAAKFLPQQAVDAVKTHIGARTYMWQDAEMEQLIKTHTRNSNATYAPSAKLIWYNAGDELNPRHLKLAYKVDVYAKEPLSRADYFIDAQTGEYLGKKDKIHQSDAVGTAATYYSGSQTIHSDLNGGSYRLRDYTKGNGIFTWHGESGQRGNDYTSTSANWNLSGINKAALDAHYGVSQTYSFYLTNFNRNSYDNNGTALVSYVNDPTYTDNAFWDGETMNFNKRSDLVAGGVTGIDVTGHELTHGVTQETSGLIYSGESGAMNESMSDIMGKSVQFWSKPGDVNWQMSNDMNWIIRDMSNPNAYWQPDTYKGSFWYYGSDDHGGVHTNSGVGNFMFYLLVSGGNGTNDLGNSFSVSAIGLSKADQIIYRSETVYLSPNSKYTDWRTACISAATDLYGASSNEVIQVKNAWYAVGVGTSGSETCNTPTGLAAANITKTSATLSWSAASGASKYKLQWKVSTATTWNTVTGITGTSYNLTSLTASTTYKFRVLTICTGGTTTAYGSAKSFTTSGSGGVTYCTSNGANTDFEWINEIKFRTIDNISGNDNGYGNYTNLSANVSAGSTYRISLIPGYGLFEETEYWTVYIDYNQNGILNDPGEKVVTGWTNTSAGGYADITIPLTAKNGVTRMRIQMHYGSQISNPCAKFDYGEAEDYTLNVSGGSGIVAATASSKQDITVKSKAGLTVSPNPVSGSNATVSYTLTNNGESALKVMDLSGRVVKTIQLGNKDAGAYIYNLSDLGRLPSGNYFISLEQNGQTVTRNRFIIIR